MRIISIEDGAGAAAAFVLSTMLFAASLPPPVSATAAARLPSPSCMLNGNASSSASATPLPHPCPLPRGWDVDWSVLNSTALLSTNPEGYYPPKERTWGWVTLDWQANRAEWLVDDDPKNTRCQQVNAANCAALKSEGKVRRCTIYHNLELALEWIESDRAVMDEEHVDAGWFLRYPNGTAYDVRRKPPPDVHNPNQPLPILSQWFVDWRNRDAAEYFVASILEASSLPGVDGTFTDDARGAGTEHADLGRILRLTDHELREIEFATQQGGNYLATVLAMNGKTCFDCVGGQVSWTGAADGVDVDVVGGRGGFGYNQRPPPRTQIYGVDKCTEWMRNYCAPGMQGRGMFMDWDVRPDATDHEQTMAAFLITRPPVAFIGSYMMRGEGEVDPFPPHKNAWSPLFNLDVGVPRSLCEEVEDGIFRREWSKGVAALDCHTYTATLDFESFPTSVAR
uniref:Uncharacterized protein n=2 Tax=Odontella aurita TaxID=265563 RepID=A0A7S4IGH6_9STRA|mmetsp:Transcript_24856/g.72811  ORF Transcript_24856/g.72811 Transcript_24856/m.72811 type:complete len:453 (+) Transcript_24856:93-1451(+)